MPNRIGDMKDLDVTHYYFFTFTFFNKNITVQTFLMSLKFVQDA